MRHPAKTGTLQATNSAVQGAEILDCDIFSGEQHVSSFDARHVHE